MSLTPSLLLAAALVPLVLAYVIAGFRDPLRFVLPPYAVLIPFSDLISFAPGSFGSLSSLLGLFLGVSLVAQLVTTRRASAQLTLVVPVWLAFLALCGFSVFWSIAPVVTANGFATLASQVLLFAAIALTRFDRATLRSFETSIALGGILVVGYGLAQLTVLGGLPAFDGGSGRFGDDLLGANNQAASLLLPIAIVAGRALTARSWERVVYGAATPLLLLGVTMTGSRGGLISSVVVLAIVLVLCAARRATVVVLAATAAALIAVVLLVNPAGLGTRQLSNNDSASGRTDIWAVGLHGCRTHCLTGAGWGGFPTMYEQEQASVPEARVLLRGTAYEPHNVALLAVTEVGVLGLLLVVVGLALAVRSAVRLPRAVRGPPVAAIVGTLVSSIFLSNLEYKFFWAVLAYVVISEAVAKAPEEDDEPRPTPDGYTVPAVREGTR